MTSSQTEGLDAKRLPWEKPELRSISLVAEQVLGVGCKTIPNNSNPLTTNPSFGCAVNGCQTTLGS